MLQVRAVRYHVHHTHGFHGPWWLILTSVVAVLVLALLILWVRGRLGRRAGGR